jgi:hypothetical protein
MEALMKKLFLAVVILGILLFSGCSDDGIKVEPLTLNDYIGNWQLSGEFLQDLDGRSYTTPLDTLIYIREGMVTDTWGYAYNISLRNGILSLSRDYPFEGTDPYCGYFEGGSLITFTFDNVNPGFAQTYMGTIEGSTAVFTHYCGYKPMVITGNVFLTKQAMP